MCIVAAFIGRISITLGMGLFLVVAIFLTVGHGEAIPRPMHCCVDVSGLGHGLCTLHTHLWHSIVRQQIYGSFIYRDLGK